ncbi:50S ribosomal protein L23 [Enterococcus dispar]|nr:50S ribosomal protein L23 [Enterococcus dispar]
MDTKANKTLVKQAVEAAFDGVKVKNVNIVNVRPKFKRMGKYAGYTKKRRKAIVTLTEESKEITIFEAE